MSLPHSLLSAPAMKHGLPPKGLRCFVCLEPIPRGRANRTEVFVSIDFCHSSYWDREDGKIYGRLGRDEMGWLYICKKCDAGEAYSSPLGEGYESCYNCGATFSSDELDVDWLDETGDAWCPKCIRAEKDKPRMPDPDIWSSHNTAEILKVVAHAGLMAALNAGMKVDDYESPPRDMTPIETTIAALDRTWLDWARRLEAPEVMM